MTDTSQARKIPEGVIEARMGNLKVYVRESDRFVKVSLISKGQKDWAHWSRSGNAKRIIARAEKELGQPVVDRITTSRVENRGIFAHEQIARHFIDWISNRHEEDGYHKDQVVYVATSPRLNAIKIGMWTGKDKGLRSRYATYYGSSVKIYCWDVVLFAKEAETDIHDFLKNYRLEGELFSVEAHDKAVTRLCELYGNSRII